MNGAHSFRYDSETMAGDNPTGSRGFIKHRSMDNCFPSIPSPLSRSASRRRTTVSKRGCSFFRSSSSRKGTDAAMPSPSSKGSWQSQDSKSSSSASFISKSMSGRSSAPIMFSNSSGMLKPPPVEWKLECTLEELCFGCRKKVKITRDVVTKTGQIILEEELLNIKVKPGWKQGTKITFEGMGNERPGAHPADLIFVIAEKRHPLFRRAGDDLEFAVEIPLVKALTGCKLSIPLGMPRSKEQGNRGNLKITFLVDFPTQLTDEQRSDILSILQDTC